MSRTLAPAHQIRLHIEKLAESVYLAVVEHPRAARRGGDDLLTQVGAVRERFPDFAALIAAGDEDDALRRLRRAEVIGRPIGGEDFLTTLEARSKRRLAPAKRRRKPTEISALSP